MAKRKRKPKPRIVHVECRSPHLYRWFRSQLTYAGRFLDDARGFEVLDEERWAALLSAAEGRET